jgi:hypothetical protein
MPVPRPAYRHGLPLLRQTVAAQRTQPRDPARGTIFVLPLLIVVSSANVVRWCCGLRDALAMAVSVRTRGFSWRYRFSLGSGHDELRHGDAVLSSPLDLLLIRETGAVPPALLGRPATASAVLARKAFRRAGGFGRTRQRDPGAGQKLLRDEQPNERPSQASCADWKHTSTGPRNGLQSVEPSWVRSPLSGLPGVQSELPMSGPRHYPSTSTIILAHRLGVKRRPCVNCGRSWHGSNPGNNSQPEFCRERTPWRSGSAGTPRSASPTGQPPDCYPKRR